MGRVEAMLNTQRLGIELKMMICPGICWKDTEVRCFDRITVVKHIDSSCSQQVVAVSL